MHYPVLALKKMHELERMMDIAQERKRAELTGQLDLFAQSFKQNQEEDYVFQIIEEWTDKETLEKEKEVAGFYLSAHPLESYKPYLTWCSIPSFSESLDHAKNFNSPQEYQTIGCGILKSRRDIITKKGDRMAFIQLEDMGSTAEIILFPRIYQKVSPWLDQYQIFFVKGSVDISSQQKCKIKADECMPLDLFFDASALIAKISLTASVMLPAAVIENLTQHINPGSAILEILFIENGKTLRLATSRKIALDQTMLLNIEKLGFSIQLQLK